MHSFTAPTLALAALAAIPAVSAHGHVSGVISGGKWYAANDPNWFYETEKPKRAGWYAYDQDEGYVSPSAYNTNNITCHKGATPGTTYIPVKAGSSIDLQWSEWPESHHGPVITHMARCHTGGDCTKATPESLNFFTIDRKGLNDASNLPGDWASDDLIRNNNTWTVTIPSGLSGHFVLRHEIIALHSAFDQEGEDGAQNYPNCINLKVSGSGRQHPCLSGADCRRGTELYKANEPGILINIYEAMKGYKIPGPKVWGQFAGKVKRVAKTFVS